MTGSSFQYDQIPAGYYDHVAFHGNRIQRAWHRQKFARVRRAVNLSKGEKLLDIGCGPGTFLGGIDDREVELEGVDIAPLQIEYAQERYGTPKRKFQLVSPGSSLPFPDGSFDAVTAIELIEHFSEYEIHFIANEIARVLTPSGTLVLTTPNYLSFWPLLELLVGWLSPVAYREQHVTRLIFPGLRSRLPEVLGRRFEMRQATTIHFAAPFLALFSPVLSDRLAHAVPPANWRWPFGALIIAKMRKI